jgi:AraC-like DNA-binding protein
MAIEYVAHELPAELRPFVRCVWSLRGGGQPHVPETVIPDGCIEVILSFADPMLQLLNGHAELQGRRTVAGQLTRALDITPTGEMDLLGIRFHPWSAGAFLGVPAHELREQVCDADVVTQVGHILEPLDACAPSQRVALLLRLLVQRAHCVTGTPRDIRVLALLAEKEIKGSVASMVQKTGFSARRIEYLFRDHIGLPPKLFIRLARFQRALAMARVDPSYTWSRIAAQSGYFDQAHLLRDAHAIAGSVPSRLFQTSGGLTETFITGDWTGGTGDAPPTAQ